MTDKELIDSEILEVKAEILKAAAFDMDKAVDRLDEFECDPDGPKLPRTVAIRLAVLENSRLLPLLTVLAECAELLELEANAQACVCKLNPYVGGLVPCETCRCRAALARLRELLPKERP